MPISERRRSTKRKRTEDQEKLLESDRYRIVDAVWEPIVDEEKFYSVQALLKKNCVSKHNEVKPVKHNYILNGGFSGVRSAGRRWRGAPEPGPKG